MSKQITISEETGRLALGAILTLAKLAEREGLSVPSEHMVVVLNAVEELDPQLDNVIDTRVMRLAMELRDIISSPEPDEARLEELLNRELELQGVGTSD